MSSISNRRATACVGVNDAGGGVVVGGRVEDVGGGLVVVEGELVVVGVLMVEGWLVVDGGETEMDTPEGAFFKDGG